MIATRGTGCRCHHSGGHVARDRPTNSKQALGCKRGQTVSTQGEEKEIGFRAWGAALARSGICEGRFLQERQLKKVTGVVRGGGRGPRAAEGCRGVGKGSQIACHCWQRIPCMLPSAEAVRSPPGSAVGCTPTPRAAAASGKVAVGQNIGQPKQGRVEGEASKHRAWA
jgi:hypothetical protein